MKSVVLLGIVICFSTTCVFSQDANNDETKEATYIRTINFRAQKIVTTLSIQDSSKFYHVQAIIANQYRTLNDLHTHRDEQIKAIKASSEVKESIDAKVKTIQEEGANKITLLHKDYVSKLSAELSKQQVEKVKDGMTYNVVNITYNGYKDMLPNLTTEQKAQIMTWLTEAREYAMDAESSEKKHGWFGKYKGRINNYLSAAGYDLKKKERPGSNELTKEKKNGLL